MPLRTALHLSLSLLGGGVGWFSFWLGNMVDGFVDLRDLRRRLIYFWNLDRPLACGAAGDAAHFVDWRSQLLATSAFELEIHDRSEISEKRGLISILF